MYTIQVPLSEFIENGGKLEVGRKIFSKSTSAGVNAFVPIGEYDSTNANGTISVHNPIGLIPFMAEICFVEINVTPIYK